MPREIDLIFTPRFMRDSSSTSNFWNRPDSQVLFPTGDFKLLTEGLNTNTYQAWLDCYSTLVTRNFPNLANPFDLLIKTAKNKFGFKPMWSLTFSEKGFKNKFLPDTMISQLLKGREHPSSEFFRAEREAVFDNRGEPVIIERCFYLDARVHRLAVLRVSDDRKGFYYRQEEKFGRFEFSSIRYKPTHKRLILWEFFRSNQPILNVLHPVADLSKRNT